jgi:hypothetical protein
MISEIVFGLVLCVSESDTIAFRKINPDSVRAIWPSLAGYTSRSTNGIVVGMLNGDSVTVLSDKNGGIAPGTLTVSKNKPWFSISNPNFEPKSQNCEGLICSLADGLCKCDDILEDSIFIFSDFSDSTKGGCVLVEKKIDRTKSKKGRPKRKRIYLSEKEMTDRFLHGSTSKKIF